MDCAICHKPIKLVPSAAERAKRYGGKPSDYSRLFTTHAACLIAQREEQVKDLIARHYS